MSSAPDDTIFWSTDEDLENEEITVGETTGTTIEESATSRKEDRVNMETEAGESGVDPNPFVIIAKLQGTIDDLRKEVTELRKALQEAIASKENTHNNTPTYTAASTLNANTAAPALTNTNNNTLNTKHALLPTPTAHTGTKPKTYPPRSPPMNEPAQKKTKTHFPLLQTALLEAKNRYSALTLDIEDPEHFPAPPQKTNDPQAPIPTRIPTKIINNTQQNTTHTKTTAPATHITIITDTTENNTKKNFTTSNPIPKNNSEVPPIILHDTEHWTQISDYMKHNRINYSRAQSYKGGIRIFPVTIEDYRSIHKHLLNTQIQFHSFQIPSDRITKVVLRGIPQSITEEQILTDLTNKQYEPLLIKRLNGRDNLPSRLVLIHIHPKFNSIFNIKECCGLDISVEKKRIPSGPLQCHRCQRFGHSQPHCNAQYKCLKCSDNHSTHLCPKTPTEEATCANCGGKHVASSKSCPLNPINNKPKTASYANTAAKNTVHDQPKTNNTNNIANFTFPLFQALMSSNPTPETILTFTTQLAQLTQLLKH